MICQREGGISSLSHFIKTRDAVRIVKTGMSEGPEARWFLTPLKVTLTWFSKLLRSADRTLLSFRPKGEILHCPARAVSSRTANTNQHVTCNWRRKMCLTACRTYDDPLLLLSPRFAGSDRLLDLERFFMTAGSTLPSFRPKGEILPCSIVPLKMVAKRLVQALVRKGQFYA